MIDAILDAIQSLSQRLAKQEARPYNPYLPDAQFFDHFAGDGTIDARWTSTLVGSGTVTIPNATPTIARLDTGATLSSSARLSWGSNFSLVGMAKSLDVVARFAITTAVDADDELILQLFTGAEVIDIGVRGAVSTAFYSCRTTTGGPTTTTTTVPVDTAQHLFRAQTMPDRVRFYIDNALVAEHLTNLPTAAPLMPRLIALNGANGGTRTMDVDLIWIREGR